MKFFKIFAFFISTFLLCLFINSSSAATAPSQTGDISREKERLTRVIDVAVAGEPNYLILVEKNLQRLRVLEYDRELKVIADLFAATGRNSGIKEISGDSKTPEGIYFITRIFKDDTITIFGDRAFHLDYPNFFDRNKGRNGDGIYIHGTNKELLPNSTNGCVTLAKNDLDQLEEYLNRMVTPVIIIPEINSLETDTVLLTENNFRLAKSLLLKKGIKPGDVEFTDLYVISTGDQTVAVSKFIYRPFSRTIMRGASKAYLHYTPAQGWTIGKRIWQASPLQVFPENPVKVAASPFVTGEITIAEHVPQGTPAPVAASNSSVTPEIYISPDKVQNPEQQVIAGAAQLDLKKTQDKKKTLAESNKQIIAQKKREVKAPAIIFDQQQILDFVESWRKAWESQQIEPYLAFYDNSFRSGNSNLEEWKRHQEIINKAYSSITVDISDIKIYWSGDGARVSFRQKYISDHYSRAGNKILYLVHNGSGWKIKGEFYSGI